MHVSGCHRCLAVMCSAEEKSHASLKLHKREYMMMEFSYTVPIYKNALKQKYPSLCLTQMYNGNDRAVKELGTPVT